MRTKPNPTNRTHGYEPPSTKPAPVLPPGCSLLYATGVQLRRLGVSGIQHNEGQFGLQLFTIGNAPVIVTGASNIGENEICFMLR